MAFNTLQFAWTFFMVLVLFNLIIVVHELGHFLAARWRGLKVDRFAIWFGKPIWKAKVGEVTYCLGWIPAGGYVSLPQMVTMEAIEGKTEVSREELAPISALDKIIVAFAGPLFSFLLAVVLACAVWALGRPVGESEMPGNVVIGYVEKDSPAEKVGMLPGDRIIEVDGHPVRTFAGMTESVTWYVARSEGDKIPFKIEREGKVQTFEPEPTKSVRKGWGRKSLRQVRIEPKLTPIIGKVEPGTPAAAAGLQAGDIVFSVDGKPMFHYRVLGDVIRAEPTRPVVLVVQRGDRTFEVKVTPVLMPSGEGAEKMPRIGIAWDPDGKRGLQHPKPSQQIAASAQTILNTLGALFSPKSHVKAEHLSGPIGIMGVYFAIFQTQDGLLLALWFSVVLNVNLAILNMLPFPVLDGGHIVLAILEAIRRKPVNIKVLEALQSACVILLLGFMLYVSFFDVQDLPFFRNRVKQDVPAASPVPKR